MPEKSRTKTHEIPAAHPLAGGGVLVAVEGLLGEGKAWLGEVWKADRRESKDRRETAYAQRQKTRSSLLAGDFSAALQVSPLITPSVNLSY